MRKHFEGVGPAGEPTTVQMILAGDIDLVINTPHGSSGGRTRAWTATRSGPPRSWRTSRASRRCRGSAAAVQGIEAMERGEIGVRSLQDWALRRSVEGAP